MGLNPVQVVAVPHAFIGHIDQVISRVESLRRCIVDVLMIDADLGPGEDVVDRPGQVGFAALVLLDRFVAGELLGFVQVGGVAAAILPEHCPAADVAAAVLQVEEVRHWPPPRA